MPGHGDAAVLQDSEVATLWYVAYGSNLARARLRHYLAGGRPEGSMRVYEGCRNCAEPVRDRPTALRGRLLFAGRSRVWTGGMAFVDPDGDGTVAARAYLLRADQVNDLVAQELRLPPGTELGLTAARDRRRTIGAAGYDTALRLDDIEGLPAVSITSARRQEPTSPSAAYLRWIAVGLHEAYRWTPGQVADYLSRAPGIAGTWTPERLQEIARLATAGVTED